MKSLKLILVPFIALTVALAPITEVYAVSGRSVTHKSVTHMRVIRDRYERPNHVARSFGYLDHFSPLRAHNRSIVINAALRHGVNPNFALAVSKWESNWNQEAISPTGAVGLMQIEPYAAAYDGPRLLHRSINIYNPYDNADLGVAMLRHYLDEFGDPKLALAAYYQGEFGTLKYGIYPTSHRYVDGIWALRNQYQNQG